MTHTYVGPDTGFGLKKGTPCRMGGKVKSNGLGTVRIVDSKGNRWLVRGKLVQRLS